MSGANSQLCPLAGRAAALSELCISCTPCMQVVLQKRSSRGYLMGFADLNLDGVHELYVMYKFNSSFYEMNGASILHVTSTVVSITLLQQ